MKGGKIMNYEINDETLVLVPMKENKCEVIEKTGNIPLDENTFKVIEHSCDYFGVKYKSRVSATYKFIKTKYRPPVMIEESSKTIFFPVSADANEDNLWFCFNQIRDYKAGSAKKETVVTFKNGFTMVVPVSLYSFNSQYIKSARLYASYSLRSIKKN